ncbi:MAG: hypothetical protein RL685_6116 [Pseudomonadota bacterium]|jgi:hypothetical protein
MRTEGLCLHRAASARSMLAILHERSWVRGSGCAKVQSLTPATRANRRRKAVGAVPDTRANWREKFCGVEKPTSSAMRVPGTPELASKRCAWRTRANPSSSRKVVPASRRRRCNVRVDVVRRLAALPIVARLATSASSAARSSSSSAAMANAALALVELRALCDIFNDATTATCLSLETQRPTAAGSPWHAVTCSFGECRHAQAGLLSHPLQPVTLRTQRMTACEKTTNYMGGSSSHYRQLSTVTSWLRKLLSGAALPVSNRPRRQPEEPLDAESAVRRTENFYLFCSACSGAKQ